MTYRVEYYGYRRPFKHPLRTSHGTWSEREGIILRLTDPEGRIGVGEIAPLPTFGSESLERALAWCNALKGQCSRETLHSIPTDLPACQFGFESAAERMAIAPMLHDVPLSDLTVSDSIPPNSTQPDSIPPNSTQPNLTAPDSTDWPYCRLLPTGHAALDTWPLNYQQGDRTFKWKIGVAHLQQELTLFQQLMEQLPADVWLRLD
ncbi:MAG: o-succinylbenzoate synthase, partial [Leptolyngbyaceae bacterium]|nr:o-succinylbenzoate synthase [Leptolyngbyaceae bacterium]